MPVPVPYRAHTYGWQGYSGGYPRPAPTPMPAPTYRNYGPQEWGGGPSPTPIPPSAPVPGATSVERWDGGSTPPPAPAAPASHYGRTALTILSLALVAAAGVVLIWTVCNARAAARGGQSPPAQRSAFFNPLNLKVGFYFSLDLLDYEGHQFRIEEIKEYTVELAGETFKFAAYCGVSRQPGKEPVRVQVRVENRADVGPESGEPLAVVALHLVDEFGYKEDFHKVVTDDTGLFQFTDDATGAVTAEYHRLGSATASIPATVASMGDSSHVKIAQVEYWDYKRQIEGDVAEFLFVELDKSDGWFRLYVGPEIDSESVKA